MSTLIFPDFKGEAACYGISGVDFYAPTPPGRWIGDTPEQAKAKAVCRGCPVRNACLKWALDHDEGGVWGGTTEADRARYKGRTA